MRKQGHYLSSRVEQLCLQFLNDAIELGATFKLIKPHMNTLLFEIIFPILCFSDYDQELWNEDPYEFVRRSQDFESQFIDPRISAINLLLGLVKGRRRHCLPQLMQFISTIFTEYHNSGSTPLERSQNLNLNRKKEGVGLILGSLASTMLESSTYSNQIENILTMHVLPDFGAQHGFLRLRTCWYVFIKS